MADLQTFLAKNRGQADQLPPVDLRGAIAKTNEKQDAQGVLPYVTNALNSVSRGMTQMIETPYNIINNAPRLVNLLPGDQGAEKISEMAKHTDGTVGKVARTLFPSEDPLIDAVDAHYPGMGGVGGIKTPNPNYPSTSNIAEAFGSGVTGMGMTSLAAKTPGIAGKFAQYLSAPVMAAPKTAVAAELASAAGGETGRVVAEKNDFGPVATFFAQLLGSLGPGALAYSAPVMAAPKTAVAAELASAAGGETGRVVAEKNDFGPVATFFAQLLGSLGPGALAYSAPNAIGKLFGREGGAETLAAMERQGVRPSVGMTGGRSAAQIESGASALPFFSSVPENVREQQFSQFADKLTDTAAGMRPAGSGPMTNQMDLAQQTYDIAEQGAKRMRDSFGGREDALQAAIGPTTGIDVTATRKAIADMMPRVDPEMQGALQHELDLLDQMILKNKTTTMQPKASSIVDETGAPMQTQVPVTTETATNMVPYEQFRSWRTNVGRRTDQPSIKGGQSKQLYQAITQDLTGAADKAGVGDDFRSLMADQAAAHADDVRLNEGGDIPQADKLGSGQLERSGQFLKQAYANPDKMEYIQRNATPEQWGNLRANIAHDLGLAKAGAQDAAGEVVSPTKFITEWNKMDPRVKNMLFDDDLGTRQTLDDLALIADAFKKRGLEANSSRTAGTGMGAMEIKNASKAGALLATGAGAATNLPATLTAMGMTYATVKGLMSETLARWAAGQTPTIQGTVGARLPGAVAHGAQEGQKEEKRPPLRKLPPKK